MKDTHEVGSEALAEVGYRGDGAQEGRLSARACLKTCMRLSPDRIFLTALRNEAAWDCITSANTDHPGGIFSTHMKRDGVFQTWKATNAGSHPLTTPNRLTRAK